MLMRTITSQKGSTFVGILIGLMLGLSIALGVAWYINKLPNPFSKVPQAPLPPKAETPSPKPTASPPVETAKPAEAKAAAEKPWTPDTVSSDTKELEKKATPAGQDTFFIQAGSFQNVPDADNMKARLALMGLEASVQSRDLGEKGVWHRVRVGPYRDLEELNRVRGVLKQNGIDAALVKVRENEK
jgi:cell division protein FtsN